MCATTQVLNFLWSPSRENSPAAPSRSSRNEQGWILRKPARRQSSGPQIYIPSLQDLPATSEGHFEGGDDEQEEMRVRFEAEGFRSEELTDAKKLLHVWRWLVDSETNCTSLRNQLDKLHKQQSAEMKEVESYIEHIQSLFEEKVSRVQFDNRALRRELEQKVPSDLTVSEIRRLLQQEGLGDSSTPMTLAEQVAFVLSERARLKEELDRQRERELRLEENRKLYNNLPESMKLSATTSTADDNNLSDDDPSSDEGDYARIRSPPPSPPRRQSRIDSKRQIEDSVKRNIRDPGNIKPMIADKQWIKNLLQDSPRTPTSPGNANSSGDEQNANNRLQSRIETLTDKLLHMEKSNRQLELDNETLGFKLSEAMVQCDELEQRLRLAKEHTAADKSGVGSRSQPESPVKQSFMQTLDNRITSSDVGLMDHCKKLHKEVVSLQDQLYQTSQKLEAMTLKYQDKKIRQQEKIHSLRELHRAEVTRLIERIEGLQTEVKSLQDEKKNLLKSLLEREEGLVTRAPDSAPKDSAERAAETVPTRL